MGFADIVRSGVATANRLTASLQVSVQHEAWIGTGDYAAPQYAEPASRPALVEMKQRERRLATGEVVVQVASVTIVGPLPAEGSEGRREPLDPRDRITLPNGYVGRIIDVRGLADPKTGQPYLYVVAVGEP